MLPRNLRFVDACPHSEASHQTKLRFDPFHTHKQPQALFMIHVKYRCVLISITIRTILTRHTSCLNPMLESAPSVTIVSKQKTILYVYLHLLYPIFYYSYVRLTCQLGQS